MSFFEFPHTRTYDSDLGFIIKWIRENQPAIENLEEWRSTHEREYQILSDKVDGLINNLVDVIAPWDSSIAYHIFSIVEDQGANYIAIQDVPVGAMITDNNYWQQANTVVEQINAMSVIVSNMDKWRPYITPEEYGAAGDGVTDDTLAIENAIADSLVKHVPLVMPQTYLVDGLTIDDDNVQIYCTGTIKYTGVGFAITLSSQFTTLHIELLEARNGSGLLITPVDRAPYLLDININVLRANDYGIKLKDYVDPDDPTHRYGILYNRIKCGRIRVDSTVGHALDFESAYFIGETDMDIELIDYAKWALYAVCTGDAINAIRTHHLAMEGDLDCIYLDNVRSCIFNGLRYGETVGHYGRTFLIMNGNCFANQFNSPTQIPLSSITLNNITGLQYNQLNMPISNDQGRLIGLGAKINQCGVKMISDYTSATTIGSGAAFDFYTENFNGIRPTQLNITKANTSSDHVKIYLDHSYAWDGINRITILMNGANYRPVVYAADGTTVIYDFRNLAGSENNGAYEIIFNRSTDTAQSIAILKPGFVATVGSIPL